MNWNYKHLLDNNFHPDSRVWIYQCNRLFTVNEVLEIEEMLKEFISKWESHGSPVKGAAYLFFGQFIILMADETATGIGGCSTDDSMRMIKGIEQKYEVNLFDRTTLAFVIKDKVELLPLPQLQYGIDKGFINADTLFFNNLVQTKAELKDRWIVAVKNSWLTKKVSLSKPVS